MRSNELSFGVDMEETWPDYANNSATTYTKITAQNNLCHPVINYSHLGSWCVATILKSAE